MANTKKLVLKLALLGFGLAAVSAQASELWLSSKPQFEIAGLAGGTGIDQAIVSVQADGGYSAQTTSATKPATVTADDIFMKNLYAPAATLVTTGTTAAAIVAPTGSGSAATSSDASACNMVASWAGTSGFSGGASCTAKQWSTIASLEQTKDMTVVAALPIGGSSESVFIGDVTGNPEPGTWAMMVGGVALLGYFKRRQAGARS